MRKPLPFPPHSPPIADDFTILAFKALAQGNASESQQMAALHHIIYELARYYDLSYRELDTHATAFAEGKRFVGAQIVKLINIVSKVKDA